MTYEAVIIEKYGANSDGGLRRRTVASNAAISFGSLLQLSNPNTAALSSTLLAPFAGIAAIEKKNNDYSPTITVFTDVVADLRASGAITIGGGVTLVGTAGLNYVSQAGFTANAASYAGVIVGVCEEEASDNETVRVRIHI